MSGLDERGGRPGAFEVLFGATQHKRVLAVVFAIAAAHGGVVGLLSVAIGAPDHPALLAASALVALVASVGLLAARDRFSVGASYVVGIAGGAGVLVACYAQGPSGAPVLTGFVVAAAALACALYPRRDAVLLLLITLGSGALFFFVYVPDVPSRMIAFVYSFSLAAVVGSVTTFVVTKIQRLAASEQAARAEAEEARVALEAANRHKSEFLANMSHELRTPLNAVIGFSDVLDERLFGDLNDKQADYVDDIRSSGQHLLALINDVLDLSKVEAGRMELELAPVAVDDLVGAIMSLFRDEAARHSIDLDSKAEPGVGTINVDERKVRQVLVNLVANALKFTPDGGRICVAARRAADGHVVIAVSDTGPGIAPAQQERIFEEFAQLSTNGRTHGTGLGLALARRFAELHGGKLTVESRPGDGATFLLRLPAQPQPATPAAWMEASVDQG